MLVKNIGQAARLNVTDIFCVIHHFVESFSFRRKCRISLCDFEQACPARGGQITTNFIPSVVERRSDLD